jgi:hypothetical protein
VSKSLGLRASAVQRPAALMGACLCDSLNWFRARRDVVADSIRPFRSSLIANQF